MSSKSLPDLRKEQHIDRAAVRRHKKRVRWHHRRIAALRQRIARRQSRIKRLRSGDRPAVAAKFIIDRYGWHEDPGRPNRAAWLDKWAHDIGPWMVAQPWCGLTVYEAAKAAGVELDKRVVSTVFIRQAAQAGTGGFKAWHPASATPQLGWVPVYGTASTGPVHTGMWVGREFGEGNTSPSSGSQNDGGGVWPKSYGTRRGWLLGYAEIDWEAAA